MDGPAGRGVLRYLARAMPAFGSKLVKHLAAPVSSPPPPGFRVLLSRPSA